MKKSTVLVGIFFLSWIFLNACSKKEQLRPVNDPPEQNQPAPLSAPLFDELNETIARFDPLYLQIVYKDKRSKSEINDEASRLLVAINQNPTSLEIQKKLIEFYHFKSFADLQNASNIISNNAGALKKSFLGQDTVLSKAKMHQLNEARKTFIKNKISTLEKASQRSSTGLWQDNAAWILDEFHYYSQIGNLEVGLDEIEDLGGAGSGPGCNESCCLEYVACQQKAKQSYYMSIIVFTFMSVEYLTTITSKLTVNNPAFNPTASLVGFSIGFAGATLLANEFYKMELNTCIINYKACILKKNGN
ncbi:MAG: hypothetical protein WCG90_01795 [Chitinophagia bacterium]